MNSDDFIRQATLSIVQYAHHVRMDLNERNRSLPWHIMTYLKSGYAIIRINGDEYECEPGTVALIPANVTHDHIAQNENNPAVFLWWHFTYMIANTLDVLKFFEWPITFKVRQNTYFEQLFSQYLDFSDSKGSFTNSIMAQARSLEIIAIIFENMLAQEKVILPTGDIPMPFFSILNEIIQHPENGIHLKELSEHHHMHPTYISNRFKHHFGVTPTQLRQKLIMEKARKLLRSSDSSITEIAIQLGFSDLSAFTQTFVQFAGYSPTQYRQGISLAKSDNTFVP